MTCYRICCQFSLREQQDVAPTYIAEHNILNQVGVQVGLGNDLLQKCVEDVVQLSVLEAALEAFGHGRAEGKGDDDVVGILLGAAVEFPLATSRKQHTHQQPEASEMGMYSQLLNAADAARGRLQLVEDGLQSLGGHFDVLVCT